METKNINKNEMVTNPYFFIITLFSISLIILLIRLAL
jgi:hypothetical protein